MGVILSSTPSKGAVLSLFREVTQAETGPWAVKHYTSRHTFLRTALTRKRSNSPAGETAFDNMLQGAVKEVSVHPLHVSELVAGVVKVWLSSCEPSGLSAQISAAIAQHRTSSAPGCNRFVPLMA